MSASRLTVVLTNYNHGRYLRQSLAALFAQTRPPDELIVIDDASSDDSVAVIQSMLAGQPHARLERNARNLGVIPNLNRGLEMAGGTIIHFAAADDVTYPTLFATGVALLNAHRRAALFSARSDIIDDVGCCRGVLATPLPLRAAAYVGPSDAARELMRDDGWFMGNTTLYRRAPLLAAGGFSEELGAFADGYVARLLTLQHGACFSPEILAAWRRLKGGMAWTVSADPRMAKRLAAVAEAKMRQASDVFPAGYPRRWRRRFIFGARRFALARFCRGPAGRGSLLRIILAIVEAAGAVSLLLAIRPWDVATVARRRLLYLTGREAQSSRS